MVSVLVALLVMLGAAYLGTLLLLITWFKTTDFRVPVWMQGADRVRALRMLVLHRVLGAVVLVLLGLVYGAQLFLYVPR